MDFTATVFELIDMRSFSNLWYWIALAVTWSSASHWVLGVPWDMVQRARRRGGQASADLEAMVAINVGRVRYIGEVAGLWLLGLASFLLSGLAMLGFWYGVEFCQAVFLIALPMSIVGAMRVAAARRLAVEAPRGEALCRRLDLHRFWVQVIGMISIFVTAFWGMLQNMQIGVLGN